MQHKAIFTDDPIENDIGEFFKGIGNKVELLKRIENHRIKDTRHSLSAAVTDTGLNPRTLLERDQLLDCADGYANNGIIRTAVDKTVWFILGERIRTVVEPNDELTEGESDDDIRKIEKRIAKDTLKDAAGNSLNLKELRRDVIRFNKRVQFNDALTKMLTSVFVFGRGFEEISLNPEVDKWEPLSLKHLHPLRIVDTKVNPETYDFEGIYYNYGRKNKNKVLIKPTNLISAWHDDNNVFDNTYYSGMSPVWSALSASQTIETILDENLPEFVKAIAEGVGLIYSGTNKKSVSEQIKKELKHSTIFIHNYEHMRFDKIDLARDPNELLNIINGLAKYICQAINLPLFLMFEDTANFATANQVMQVFKVSTLNRYRTWLQGILEKCWYDQILAAHLKIDVEDVIFQEIKLKPIFEDINFETRLEVIQGEKELLGMAVHERLDVAKAIKDKASMNRIAFEDAAIEEDKEASIEEGAGKPMVEKNPQGKLETRGANDTQDPKKFPFTK